LPCLVLSCVASGLLEVEPFPFGQRHRRSHIISSKRLKEGQLGFVAVA
jgi:hypothetical protein